LTHHLKYATPVTVHSISWGAHSGQDACLNGSGFSTVLWRA